MNNFRNFSDPSMKIIEKEAIIAKLTNAPDIELVSPACEVIWKQVDTLGYGCLEVIYAERWAQLMQVEMANGKTLEEVAYDTLIAANFDGVSSGSRSEIDAIEILLICWKHGEQLYDWHKMRSQPGNGN